MIREVLRSSRGARPVATRSSRAISFVLGAVVSLTLAVGGCKPKVGAACKIETKEVCTDDRRALGCHDGKWEEMTCRGPEGCTKASGEHVCDQSVVEENEVCNLADDYVCTPDKKSMLQCVKNRWTLSQMCLGDRGCTMEKKKVTCDNSVASVGDACPEEEDYACSVDKKTGLKCRGGKFVLTSTCKGLSGCRVTGARETGFKVECDDSIAAVGDACEKEEHFSCSSDERSILRCRAKKFEVEEKCKSKEKCAIKNGLVGCL